MLNDSVGLLPQGVQNPASMRFFSRRYVKSTELRGATPMLDDSIGVAK